MLNLIPRPRRAVAALLRSFPVPPPERKLPRFRVPAAWTHHPTPREAALLFVGGLLTAAWPGWWWKVVVGIVVLECWVVVRAWIAPLIAMRRELKLRSTGEEVPARSDSARQMVLSMRQVGVSVAELLVGAAMLATVAATGEVFWLLGRAGVSSAESVLETESRGADAVALPVMVAFIAAVALCVISVELRLWLRVWAAVRRWVYAGIAQPRETV